MTSAGPAVSAGVTVRYWASAKAAAGTDADVVPVSGTVSVAEVVAAVCDLRGPKLAAVVAACSVLVGDKPLGTRDPADVLVSPGDVVELLPPFAGG